MSNIYECDICGYESDGPFEAFGHMVDHFINVKRGGDGSDG